MKKPALRSLIRNTSLAFLVFLGLTLSVIPNGFGQTTQLKVVAPTASIAVPTQFNIDIAVVDVTDLYTWQIKLYYNPTVLRWINGTYPTGHVFEGNPFAQIPPVNDTDVDGTYILFTATLLGDVPRFSGSGTLCRISFEAQAQGTSPLTFSTPYDEDTWLLNYDLNTIPATLVDGSVNVVRGLTLTIALPLNGSEVRSSTVTVTWTVSDESSAIDHNEIRLDGGSWVDVGTNTAETFTGLSDGSHTADVKAFNEVGMSTLKSVSFVVNTGVLFGLGYVEVIAIFAVIIVLIGIMLYFLRIRRKR